LQSEKKKEGRAGGGGRTKLRPKARDGDVRAWRDVHYWMEGASMRRRPLFFSTCTFESHFGRPLALCIRLRGSRLPGQNLACFIRWLYIYRTHIAEIYIEEMTLSIPAKKKKMTLSTTFHTSFCKNRHFYNFVFFL
jgi:hypothetical protein